jgi:hypothetical protein
MLHALTFSVIIFFVLFLSGCKNFLRIYFGYSNFASAVPPGSTGGGREHIVTQPQSTAENRSE